jgi:class 3 adenylate cyclase
VFDGDDFFDGGASSIAARLSGIARPGGVCISGHVYELGIPGLNLQFEDGGEVAVLKLTDNVSLRLHAWHWSPP